MEAGVYNNLSNEAYHLANGISNSGLTDIAVNPALFKAKHDARRNGEKQEDTKAFRDGRATHVAVLEPHLFTKRYFVEKTLKRTAKIAWEKLEKQQAGKEIITVDEYDEYMYLSEAVWSNQRAAEILKNGQAETSIFHIDEETGELVKVRPDWFIEDVLVDLKTTKDASKEGFGRACFNYRYYVQAPFYLDVAGAELGRQFNTFAFICVEKGTYQVAVYYADARMLQLGRLEYRRNLDKYAACKKSGIWSGYNDGKIEPISLPAWAEKRAENLAFYDDPDF